MVVFMRIVSTPSVRWPQLRKSHALHSWKAHWEPLLCVWMQRRSRILLQLAQNSTATVAGSHVEKDGGDDVHEHRVECLCKVAWLTQNNMDELGNGTLPPACVEIKAYNMQETLILRRAVSALMPSSRYSCAQTYRRRRVLKEGR